MYVESISQIASTIYEQGTEAGWPYCQWQIPNGIEKPWAIWIIQLGLCNTKDPNLGT